MLLSGRCAIFAICFPLDFGFAAILNGFRIWGFARRYKMAVRCFFWIWSIANSRYKYVLISVSTRVFVFWKIASDYRCERKEEEAGLPLKGSADSKFTVEFGHKPVETVRINWNFQYLITHMVTLWCVDANVDSINRRIWGLPDRLDFTKVRYEATTRGKGPFAIPTYLDEIPSNWTQNEE